MKIMKVLGFILLGVFIIFDKSFANPISHRLPVVAKCDTLLVVFVLYIADFHKDRNRVCVAEHIQITGTDSSFKASSRLVVVILLLERRFHCRCQFAALPASGMVKENIRLFALAPAVNMDEQCPFVFVLFPP